MTTTMTARWVRLDELAMMTAELRTQLLCRTLFDLLLVQVMLRLHGLFPAAMVYAARGARVRLESGEVVIWAGP